jgi:hypothetical protein
VPSINCGSTAVHEDRPIFVRARAGPAEPGWTPTAAIGEGTGPAAAKPSQPVSPARTRTPVSPAVDRIDLKAMSSEQLAIEVEAAGPHSHRGLMARVQLLMRRAAAEEASARLGMLAEKGAP